MERLPIPERLLSCLNQLVAYRPTELLFVRCPTVKARVARRRFRQLLVGVRGERCSSRGEDGHSPSFWSVPAEVARASEVARTYHHEEYAYSAAEAWKRPSFRAAVRAGCSPDWGAVFAGAVESALALGGEGAARAVVLAELPPFWHPGAAQDEGA